MLSTASQSATFLKEILDDRSKFWAKYDDAYFMKNSLLVLCFKENSGSIKHEITSVEITFGENYENVVTVKIKRSVPQVCTEDMMDTVIFIEIPKYNRIETGTFKIDVENEYIKHE